MQTIIKIGMIFKILIFLKNAKILPKNLNPEQILLKNSSTNNGEYLLKNGV